MKVSTCCEAKMENAFFGSNGYKPVCCECGRVCEPKPEFILCAAIWYDDNIEREHQPKNTKTGLVVCGHRHHNVITAYAYFTGRRTGAGDTQGFLTSTHRFVDRHEGWKIADKAGQIIPRKGQKEGMLFSEDLY